MNSGATELVWASLACWVLAALSYPGTAWSLQHSWEAHLLQGQSTPVQSCEETPALESGWAEKEQLRQLSPVWNRIILLLQRGILNIQPIKGSKVLRHYTYPWREKGVWGRERKGCCDSSTGSQALLWHQWLAITGGPPAQLCITNRRGVFKGTI